MKWWQYFVLIAIVLIDLDWCVHFYDQAHKQGINVLCKLGDWAACIVLGLKAAIISLFVVIDLFR